MELLTLIAAFCVAVSFMLASCASDQVDVQKSLKQYGNLAAILRFTNPSSLCLCCQENSNSKKRKLFADKDIMRHKKLMEASSGTTYSILYFSKCTREKATNKVKRKKMWCNMQQEKGHGENGLKAPTSQNTLLWIMLGLEGDAPYITSTSHLSH
ncbi:hypothetical protein Pfo_009597, partial [Paulownia fortunei]